MSRDRCILLGKTTLLVDQMNFAFLLRGLIIGISIAAPVGPIGILCIRRTLTKGHLTGFISGLGAATADAVYGCIAGFGLTLISTVLIEQKFWIRLIGGIFLCYLGVKTFFSKSTKEAASSSGGSIIGSYASTFFLTLTNPMTIISFTAIFAGLGVGGSGGDYRTASFVVAGVFLGSAVWWLTLSTVVSMFKKNFSERSMLWINRIAGIIILGFGIYALISVVR
jgi:threonine/homoserine/homoserine lactone efflux protein